MGANDPPDMDYVGMKATADARPIHRVYVDGFFMDKTDITNDQFAVFVKATGYITIAERKPKPPAPAPLTVKRRNSPSRPLRGWFFWMSV